MGAAGAFRFLIGRTWANRLHVLLRRVRAPRYAFALLAAAAYYYFVFHQTSRPGSSTMPVSPITGAGIYEVLLAISIGWMWIFGVPEPALAFTSAEVQMLFPAPVTRRTLILFKLVQAQITILINVAIWLLVLSRRSQIPPLLKATALWSLFTALYLHRVGASFVRVTAAQQGRKGIRKNAVPLSIAAIAIGAVGWSVVRAAPSLLASLSDGTVMTALASLRRTPAVSVVLWPLHAIVGPIFATSPAAWARTIGWSLVILVANLAWVITSGVNFEEASMQRAERVAARRAAQRSRGSVKIRSGRAWFPLPAAGRPALAIIWKNVTALQRLVPLGRMAALLATGMIAILVFLPGIDVGWSEVGTISLSLAGIFVFMGPVYVRTDLQQDMLLLPLLKTYPMSGAQVVAAEIASTVAILAVLQVALLIVGFPQLVHLVGGARSVPIAIAGIFAVPAVTALRSVIANAWAVWLPGWIHLGPGRPTGIEGLGQNLVAIFGSAIAHALLLILPVLFALPVLFVGRDLIGDWAMVPAAVIGALVSFGELWLLVRWLGVSFSHTDPSDIEAATAS